QSDSSSQSISTLHRPPAALPFEKAGSNREVVQAHDHSSQNELRRFSRSFSFRSATNRNFRIKPLVRVGYRPSDVDWQAIKFVAGSVGERGPALVVQTASSTTAHGSGGPFGPIYAEGFGLDRANLSTGIVGGRISGRSCCSSA